MGGLAIITVALFAAYMLGRESVHRQQRLRVSRNAGEYDKRTRAARRPQLWVSR